MGNNLNDTSNFGEKPQVPSEWTKRNKVFKMLAIKLSLETIYKFFAPRGKQNTPNKNFCGAHTCTHQR